MRFRFVILLALAALTASPALADLRATYRMAKDQSVPSFTIEVSDAGLFRVEAPLDGPGSQPMPVMFGTAAGELLYVMPFPTGVVVFRADDMNALMEEYMAAAIPPDLKLPQALADTRLREEGVATVNGREGRRFLLEPPAQAGATPPRVEIVLSGDPALAPLVRAMTAGMSQIEQSPMFKRLVPPVFSQVSDLARSNAVLRVGEYLELTAVENGPIAPERLVAPGKPISREELRALFQRMMFGGRGARAPKAD